MLVVDFHENLLIIARSGHHPNPARPGFPECSMIFETMKLAPLNRALSRVVLRDRSRYSQIYSSWLVYYAFCSAIGGQRHNPDHYRDRGPFYFISVQVLADGPLYPTTV